MAIYNGSEMWLMAGLADIISLLAASAEMARQ